jgi:shikimate dehydrogenase
VSSSFAVLGSPIDHSLSPVLHAAIIAQLGIDASYGRFEVSTDDLPGFLSQHEHFEGFSLTMPLKSAVRRLVVAECDVSQLTGAVNTIVRGPEGWAGFNTDVWGAQQAIRQQVSDIGSSAVVLGAGATAQSVLVALVGLGVDDVTVLVRDTSRAQALMEVAARLGIAPLVATLGVSVEADIAVNTVPGSGQLSPEAIDAIDTAVLFDVVYDPWPTPLAAEWSARGLPVINGKSLLIWQALRQARIFYGGDADEELPSEHHILTSMRSAVGL